MTITITDDECNVVEALVASKEFVEQSIDEPGLKHLWLACRIALVHWKAALFGMVQYHSD